MGGKGNDKLQGRALGNTMDGSGGADTLVGADGNGAADGRIVEFLVLIEFVAARIACGVEVADVADVIAQSADHVTLPFLHAYNALADNKPWYNTLNLSDSVLELKD